MRYHALILVCLFSIVLNAQSNKYKICIYDNLSKKNAHLWSEVKVESKDTSFIYYLGSKLKNEILVSKQGKYSFTFLSVFGHTIQKELIVSASKKYKLKVSELSIYYKRIPLENYLSTKLQVGDTLFIIEAKAGIEEQPEKLGIIKLENEQYKALQYVGVTTTVFQDFTVPKSVFNTVINAEDQIKKQGKEVCKPTVCTFSLKRQYYTALDANCDNRTMETIKEQLFLIKGN